MTTPDCKRVGFTFDPVPYVGMFNYLGGDYWMPRFIPDVGVTETLYGEWDYVRINWADLSGTFDPVNGEALPLIRLNDGSFILAHINVPYNPLGYQLVTKDGTRYHYNQFTGLQDVTDRNGNVLTFTREGIFSSLGPSIQFVRDDAGRISQIIDPAGHAILYQYDERGDLVAFTNQVDATSTYRYHDVRPHYLVEMSDPCGCHPAVRAEYGDDGRLIAASDALGNTARQTFDLENMTETIMDELGHSGIGEKGTFRFSG